MKKIISPDIGPDMFPDLPQSEVTMPVLFIGHGNPMNAIEDNRFSRTWQEIGSRLPLPAGILVISAHWETEGTQVTGMERPRTIHDFSGFPRDLYEIKYPAPGFPVLADMLKRTLLPTEVTVNYDWGLDHGDWSVLRRMYKNADIPVMQLSLNRNQTPVYHFDLGKRMAFLRKHGILIMGSGNIVHNLRLMTWQEPAYKWANEFDIMIRDIILSDNHDKIIDYRQLPDSELAIPSNEHFLPLLYILAMKEFGEEINFFNDTVTLGSISMRSLKIG